MRLFTPYRTTSARSVGHKPADRCPLAAPARRLNRPGQRLRRSDLHTPVWCHCVYGVQARRKRADQGGYRGRYTGGRGGGQGRQGQWHDERTRAGDGSRRGELGRRGSPPRSAPYPARSPQPTIRSGELGARRGRARGAPAALILSPGSRPDLVTHSCTNRWRASSGRAEPAMTPPRATRAATPVSEGLTQYPRMALRSTRHDLVKRSRNRTERCQGRTGTPVSFFTRKYTQATRVAVCSRRVHRVFMACPRLGPEEPVAWAVRAGGPRPNPRQWWWRRRPRASKRVTTSASKSDQQIGEPYPRPASRQ